MTYLREAVKVRSNDDWLGEMWRERIERFGLEKNVDVDMAIVLRTELAQIPLTRWAKSPEVKELIKEARDVLDKLEDAMVKAFWDSVDPENESGR